MAIGPRDPDTVPFMRAKGPLRVLVLLLAASLLPATAVLATHNPQVSQVVAVASNPQTYAMSCKAGSNQQVCTSTLRLYVSRMAVITPASGPLASVTTTVNATVNPTTNLPYSMSAADQTWNIDLHEVGCASADEVGAFIANLGLSSAGETKLGPLKAGECDIEGSLTIPVTGAPAYYTVTSRELSSAFPTPTPTPTPQPTPTPTLKPTATPRPTATPTARSTAPVKPTAGSTATAMAVASELVSASESASASAVNTPEQSVLGIVFTPQPSSAPAAPAGDGGGGWAGSVPSANKVSTDPVKLAGSGLAALLLLLAMGFIGELFNDTFEGNYDRILAWWQTSWVGRIGRAFGGLWGGGK